LAPAPRQTACRSVICPRGKASAAGPYRQIWLIESAHCRQPWGRQMRGSSASRRRCQAPICPAAESRRWNPARGPVGYVDHTGQGWKAGHAIAGSLFGGLRCAGPRCAGPRCAGPRCAGLSPLPGETRPLARARTKRRPALVETEADLLFGETIRLVLLVHDLLVVMVGMVMVMMMMGVVAMMMAMMLCRRIRAGHAENRHGEGKCSCKPEGG
jgi:hypothetical protein